MNIFTFFNVVEDIDKLSDAEWETIVNNQQKDYPIRHRLSLCGESLLEQGLRIKQKMQPQSALYALSITKEIGNEQTLIAKKIQALQYSTSMVEYPFLNLFEQQDALQIVLDYLQDKPKENALYLLEYDDEIKGKSWLPAYLAQTLGIPLVSNVNTVLEVSADTAQLLVNRSYGLDTIAVALPAVISIGASDITKLRMPTMKEKLKAKSTPIQEIRLDAPIAASPNETLMGMQRASFAQRNCQKQTYDDAAVAVQALFDKLKETQA